MKIGMKDIEYFAVVAERGHIGRAAEALGLSQPALSKSLRRLEGALDAKVVKRTPKGVELTAVGKALLARVSGLRLLVEDLVREAAELSDGRAGHVRIGVVTGLTELLLAPACSALLREARHVTVDAVVENYQRLAAAVRKGELDFALGSMPAFPESDLKYERLYDDDGFVVYASARHRLASREKVTIADLVAERFASVTSDMPAWQALERAFAERGLDAPRLALRSSALDLRFAIVASSDLLGFSSRAVVKLAATRYPLKILPVDEWAWPRSVAVVSRKDGYLSPPARRLIDAVKTVGSALASAHASP